MNARPREPLPGVDEWAARLDLRNRSDEHVGPCPVCGGTDRFHVGRGRGGAAMVGCRGCIDGQPEDVRRKAFGRILRAVFPERFQSGAGERTARTPNPPERDSEPISGPDDADARRKVARRVWERARPLADTLAETYLHARGVEHVAGVPALRFHPALRHRDHPPGMLFPTLVAEVQDVDGRFVGIQRTYLATDGAGKANVKPVKASLGTPAGGAVRLAEPEPGRPLLVGEGIESTAAAMLLFDLPGWAALGGLRSIELPEHVRDVVIAADRDARGLRTAAALARRLEAEGRNVEIRRPDKGDFNDALLMAREATP